MVKKPSKRALKWSIAAVAVICIAVFVGFKIVKKKRNALPEGIVAGNGRVEGKLVDVAAREPLRVREILVAEGDLGKPSQVGVRMDTTTLESQLAEANAALAAAEEKLQAAKATIVKQRSEIKLA